MEDVELTKNWNQCCEAECVARENVERLENLIRATLAVNPEEIKKETSMKLSYSIRKNDKRYTVSWKKPMRTNEDKLPKKFKKGW